MCASCKTQKPSSMRCYNNNREDVGILQGIECYCRVCTINPLIHSILIQARVQIAYEIHHNTN